jgi:undecaprenyl-diphosphatase
MLALPNMSLWQALFLGFLQGATELFPVSSLGHTVLLPRLLGWNLNQSDPTFVPYVVLLHLGTATALLVIFRREWVGIITAFVRAVYRGSVGEDPNERLAMLLFVGTIPTALLGAFFESEFKKLFASPRIAAGFLIVNGGIMGVGELLRRRDEKRRRAEAGTDRERAFATEGDLGFVPAVIVGTSQSLALFPGISRSGSTITAGLLAGLQHESAARFSFLLATPIILAAGVLEVPTLFQSGGQMGVYLAGAVTAGVTAYVSTRFLLRYFRSGRLDPFAIYCVALGLIGLIATR